MEIVLKYIGESNASFTKNKQYTVISFGANNFNVLAVCDRNCLADGGTALDRQRWELVPANSLNKPS